MEGDFLQPETGIEKYGDKLPHWQQGKVMQFVTFRLGDSLPETKLRKWKEERAAFMACNPRPWDPEKAQEYQRKFTGTLEEWLDAGEGSCLLRKEDPRRIVGETLMKFQGNRYEHHAWVIMPNHVHLVFSPHRAGRALDTRLERGLGPEDRIRFPLAGKGPTATPSSVTLIISGMSSAISGRIH